MKCVGKEKNVKNFSTNFKSLHRTKLLGVSIERKVLSGTILNNSLRFPPRSSQRSFAQKAKEENAGIIADALQGEHQQPPRKHPSPAEAYSPGYTHEFLRRKTRAQLSQLAIQNGFPGNKKNSDIIAFLIEKHKSNDSSATAESIGSKAREEASPKRKEKKKVTADTTKETKEEKAKVEESCDLVEVWIPLKGGKRGDKSGAVLLTVSKVKSLASGTMADAAKKLVRTHTHTQNFVVLSLKNLF